MIILALQLSRVELCKASSECLAVLRREIRVEKRIDNAKRSGKSRDFYRPITFSRRLRASGSTSMSVLEEHETKDMQRSDDEYENFHF